MGALTTVYMILSMLKGKKKQKEGKNIKEGKGRKITYMVAEPMEEVAACAFFMRSWGS